MRILLLIRIYCYQRLVFTSTIKYAICYLYFPYFKPLGEGYIAIVMSKLEDADKVCSQLLSEEQYKDALRDSTTG